jgi:hypothetical protein
MTSPFEGSAMLRPIFSTSLDHTLGIKASENLSEFTCFPNPVTEELHFQSSNQLETERKYIYDASGRLILETTDNVISFVGFQTGIYFVTIPSISPKPVKIIKQ